MPDQGIAAAMPSADMRDVRSIHKVSLHPEQNSLTNFMLVGFSLTVEDWPALYDHIFFGVS